jgi:predicted HNH restriction endonuclease
VEGFVWLSPIETGGEEEARVRQSPQIDSDALRAPGRRVKGQKGSRARVASTEATGGAKPKKSRKLPTTPRSRVRSALRAMWLRSREHQACLKAAGRACERCGVKASVAKGREVKLQVHHRRGIANWEAVIDLVFAELLVDPRFLEAICVQCHQARHGKGESMD